MIYRIRYADGSMYDSDQGEPWEAPGLGVLVIVQNAHKLGERDFLQHRENYYVWEYERWKACDLFYVWQYLFVDKVNFPKVVLAGQTVLNEVYDPAVRAAKDDPDFQGVV